jgi:glycosyltransferase involved in cell wall biosynthesis
MPPKVSICIPTFNSEDFVADALASASRQTFRDTEIIVCDNCSHDSTIAICNKLKQDDPRISIYHNDFNRGLFGNLNRCLELSTGTYVKFLMSDDRLEPSCIERMLEIFDQHPTVKIVGCSQQNIDESGIVVRRVQPYSNSGLIPGRQVLKQLLLKMSNDIGAPTSVLLKKADYGVGFNRSFFFLGDFELWSRALLHGDYYFLDKPLSFLRLDAKSATSTNFKTFMFLNDILQLRDMYAGFMEEEGVSLDVWHSLVDDRIMSYVDHIILEQGLKGTESQTYSTRLLALVGNDGAESLIKAMSSLLYYAFLRLHTINIEARWNQGQVQNLEREIELMTKTMVWKMAEPLRQLRGKLSGTTHTGK